MTGALKEVTVEDLHQRPDHGHVQDAAGELGGAAEGHVQAEQGIQVALILCPGPLQLAGQDSVDQPAHQPLA